MVLVSPTDKPAQRRARAAELWRSVRERTRGSARGRTNSLSETRARVKRRRRAMECHGGRLMECHDDRKRRARERNVALQDLEKTTTSTRAARGEGRSEWCWKTRPLAALEGTTLRRRCEYGARGARLTHSHAATPGSEHNQTG